VRGNWTVWIGAAIWGLGIASSAWAADKNPQDFPLRVHIFSHTTHSHYSHKYLEVVDGEGHANLFEGGWPTAFDFSYECETRLQNSVGYSTAMARWKKRGAELELLLPAMGRTCMLKTEMKDGISYVSRNGHLEEEPSTTREAWMKKHQYDPEHGFDLPANVTPAESEEQQPQQP
jgi:hypothetical protein